MAVELISTDAPAVNQGEDARVRSEALDLAASLAQPVGRFDPHEALGLFAELVENRDRRAERVLAEVEEAEAVVREGWRGNESGSTTRARVATRNALELAAKIGEEVGREIDRVRGDAELNDHGRQVRIERILAEHRERVAKEVGQRFETALSNLAEREATLTRSFVSAKAEPVSELRQVADRLDLLAVLHAAGRSGDAVEAAVLSYATRGDRRAALALEAAARGLRDPLRVRALAAKVRALEGERRTAALFGNDNLACAAAEMHLIGVTRARIENVRGMLKGAPNEARLLAANWR